MAVFKVKTNQKVGMFLEVFTPVFQHSNQSFSSKYTHLEEQFLGVLCAVAEVSGAYVVIPPIGCTVEMQQVGSVQQDGVERVDAHASGHQQQINRGVGGQRVEKEVPAHSHGYAGTHSTLGIREEKWKGKRRKKGGKK